MTAVATGAAVGALYAGQKAGLYKTTASKVNLGPTTRGFTARFKSGGTTAGFAGNVRTGSVYFQTKKREYSKDYHFGPRR